MTILSFEFEVLSFQDNSGLRTHNFPEAHEGRTLSLAWWTGQTFI
jgi:hypothetical protein